MCNMAQLSGSWLLAQRRRIHKYDVVSRELQCDLVLCGIGCKLKESVAIFETLLLVAALSMWQGATNERKSATGGQLGPTGANSLVLNVLHRLEIYCVLIMHNEPCRLNALVARMTN